MDSTRPAPSSRRARHLVFALISVVATIAIVLAALEGGLRAYYWFKLLETNRRLPPVEQRCFVPSSDPELLYELNPGWRDETFSVNSLGMPDREITIEKPAGVFRIAFVGDSITDNFHLTPREESYVRVLERMLKQGTRDQDSYECLNFGVSGYGIQQLLRTAETRVRRFNPDLIVVQVGLNDPHPSDFEHRRFGLKRNSRLWAFVLRRVRNARFRAHSFVERLYDAEGMRSVHAGLQGLGAITRNGTPVLVVMFPYLHRPAYDDWGFAAYHETWRREAGSAGLPYLDLYETFLAAGLIDDRWPKDPIHPDARGHRVAADAILEELERWSVTAESISGHR
jgi:lysophospholipase L1-like esterase